MGEVYKARDTRLNRLIAVKVLPPEFAADPERRSRFEHEARAIAALSHPHICVVHDVGRDGDVDYLVMEHLDGETLASRLERLKGPLPLAQVVRFAGEIADALDKAHRAGVVHRDLKPANIMLTSAGAKLLDFGLAKLKARAGPVATSTVETTTDHHPTAAGTILGTVHYMAPEQVEGREADARSDIWALGVVIYEMATGTRPFEGASGASVMGAILRDTPAPMSSRQPLTPAALDHLIERCLDKDPDERWQNAGDIRRELIWIARTPSGAGVPTSSEQTVAYSVRRWPAVSTGLAIGVLAGVFVGGVALRRDSPVAPTTIGNGLRFEVLTPPEATWSPSPTASTAQLALSPDGTRLAFVAARTNEGSRIWIRPLDQIDARAVPGTEGASFPFWSPDGRFVAFFAAGKLKKVDVALGTAQTLCDVAAGRGGAWSSSGVIVFGQSLSPLSQISANGGSVTAATSFDPVQDPAWHYWPQFLPDGRHFLYLQRSAKAEHQGIYVGSLDSPQSTRLVGTDVRGVFASGHLLFVREGLLFAQPLHEQTLQLSGEPVRIADGVGYYASAFGYAAIDTSLHDVIAFGPALLTSRHIGSFDRDGKAVGRSLEGPYTAPRLSPDQKMVAIAARDNQTANWDIWVFDLDRGSPSRVTSDPSTDWFPSWTADGRHVLFGSTRAPTNAGSQVIYQRSGSGSGEDQPLSPSSPVRGLPDDVSMDGEFLLFHNLTQRGGYDIGAASMAPGGKRFDFISSGFNEVQARFSPDRRWVAYASDESGRFEVYVRSFPSGAERTLVSVGGGMQPEWRRDGRELFYLSADSRIMAVPITTQRDAIATGTPHALFSVNVVEPAAPYPNDYTVSGDGQQFVVAAAAKVTTPQTLTVLYNWTAALKQ
jgi:serine/threonine protein kinase/Tol biopolymer transport system component